MVNLFKNKKGEENPGSHFFLWLLRIALFAILAFGVKLLVDNLTA